MNRIRSQRNCSPRRVLVIAPQPFFEDRGTPIAVRELVMALSGLGFDVDLATFPVGRALHLAGVCVVRALNPFGIRRVPIGFSLKKLVLDFFLFFTALGLLRRHRYLCVHGVEEGGFIAALLAQRFDVPVVYDMQSCLPDGMRAHRVFRGARVQRALRACERWLLERADIVVCSTGLGEHVRAVAPQAVLREWSYPAQVTESDPAEAAALRRELGIAPDAPVVVYAGTFAHYQGLSEVLEAIPSVSADVPGTVFVLVGAERRSAAAVRKHAAKLGLNGNLRVVKRRPIEQVGGFFALADVLLAPRALGQNLPLKIFHYMAAGRAIVATGLRGEHGVVQGARALVTEHSPAAIACAVSQVLRDRTLASGLAARARLYAETHLHPARFASSVRELCEALRAEGWEAVGV